MWIKSEKGIFNTNNATAITRGQEAMFVNSILMWVAANNGEEQLFEVVDDCQSQEEADAKIKAIWNELEAGARMMDLAHYDFQS